jgi:hypothetical protein
MRQRVSGARRVHRGRAQGGGLMGAEVLGIVMIIGLVGFIVWSVLYADRA